MNSMNLVGTEHANQGTSSFEEATSTARITVQDGYHLPVPGDYVINNEDFRDNEDGHLTTMDSISSFLDTMHSKNLTLKRLAKVQQRRIHELTQENIALRQASEMKDKQLRRTQEQLVHMLRDVTGDADLSEIESTPNPYRSPSEVDVSSNHGPSDTLKDSAAHSRSARSANKISTSERRKTSFIVSHKVAVKRMVHLMRKINGACNRKSVGLYTFACCFAQAVLPQLLGFSSEMSPILYIPRT